jgi:hypothetical protein
MLSLLGLATYSIRSGVGSHSRALIRIAPPEGARASYELGKIIRSEYVVGERVWVPGVVDFCVEPQEKHRPRPQSTEGMCDFGREGEAVQAPLGDLDLLNAVGISIADQRRTENQCDFRPAHVVMIASYRTRRRPHYVNVLLSCQLCERECLDNEPAFVAGWSERFSDCLRKHRCVSRSLTRPKMSDRVS